MSRQNAMTMMMNSGSPMISTRKPRVALAWKAPIVYASALSTTMTMIRM